MSHPPEIYELEGTCTNCGNTMYLGGSGVDQEGLHIAYLCPACGFETCDFIPGPDDSLPAKFAWTREPNGDLKWYSLDIPFVGIDSILLTAGYEPLTNGEYYKSKKVQKGSSHA